MEILDRETTEFVFWGVDGDIPQGDVQLSLKTADQRPEGLDWVSALKVQSGHALWESANLAEPDHNWYVAKLIGPWNNDYDPGVGEYQVWVRFEDAPERPVRRPGGLEII